MTLANKITISRFLLIPVMVVFMTLSTIFPDQNEILGMNIFHFIAAIIFVIAAATDFLDGYIARKRNEITTFGKFLDPIADKVLVISAMIYLVTIMPKRVMVWTVVVVIMREFLVTGIRLLAMERGKVIAASPYGKLKTIFTMIALIVLLFNDFGLVNVHQNFEWIGNILWYVAIALTIISGVDYFIKNKEIVFESV